VISRFHALAALAALVAVLLGACAVAGLDVSSVEQDMCVLDPITGRCQLYRDPEVASAAASENYAWENCDPSSVDNAACTAANGNAVCQVSLYANGASLMLYCTVQYRTRSDGTVVITSINCGAR
jgi:hypothetical protein